MKFSIDLFSCVGISLALLISCGKGQERIVHHVKLSNDFIISKVSDESLSHNFSPVVDESCLEHIKSVTCFSDQEENGFDPKCTFKNIDQNIVEKLDELINQMPAFHKKVLCHINRLQIHTKIHSIGYAAFVQNDKNETIANLVGLRIDAIQGVMNYDLFSWKEQLNFDLAKPSDPNYSLSPMGPRVSLDIDKVKNIQLFYVLVHEIGHLIDYMNNANNQKWDQVTEDGKERTVLTLENNSFGKLSWPNSISYSNDGSEQVPREIKILYPLLSKMCFYSCKDYVALNLVNDIYKDLSESNFVTTYAASNPWEDFAETNVAFTLISQEYGYQYKIIGANNEILFDVNDQWQSDRLKEKKEWLQKLFSKNDLIYEVRTK